MVDCRSLIEFCRAYEQHKNNNKFNSHSNKKQQKNSNSLCCDHRSPFAAVDALILLLVLGSLGFLLIPYLKLVLTEITPIVCEVLVEVIDDSPVAYIIGLFVALLGVIVLIIVLEIMDMRSRKCGKPNCKGLRKAVEFDIQLESEDCVKCSLMDSSSNSFYNYDVKPLELGDHREELEAELKKMAPRNGRTVLIFRAPCGCPAGRLEVWGNKKVRRIKK